MIKSRGGFGEFMKCVQKDFDKFCEQEKNEFENLQHINFDAMTEEQKKRYKYLEGAIKYDGKR